MTSKAEKVKETANEEQEAVNVALQVVSLGPDNEVDQITFTDKKHHKK